ncbi:MAG: YfcE family phosphodiesterase [Oscillospiraceae bacterium]|jgi:putative phosphoesterase|nr:YfcE family phosphodiesterase [Oscillospiraceae bacterium]
MLKLLVLSDSHNRINLMSRAAEREKPDAVAHLGDHIADAHRLKAVMPDTAFYMVSGNCDFAPGKTAELTVTLDGVTIYMTHGHIHGVKSSLDGLISCARKNGADLALYGHTHIPLLQSAGKLRVMCPGQMERHGANQSATYGVVTIERGAFDCRIERL